MKLCITTRKWEIIVKNNNDYSNNNDYINNDIKIFIKK